MLVDFNSNTLPPTVDDAGRLDAWNQLVSEFYAASAYEPLPDHPFEARFRAAAFGRIHVGRFNGTMKRFARDPVDIASVPHDDFMVSLNTTDQPLLHLQANNRIVLGHGDGVFCTTGQQGEVSAEAPCGWLFLGVPRSLLEPACPAADNLIGQKFDASNPGLAHLRGYLQLLLDTPPDPNDRRMLQHIENTLASLIVVVIENAQDLASVSEVSAIRAERLRSAVTAMREGYHRPDFSIRDVIRKTKLSERYIRELFSESGTSFSQRLLETRLQQAYESLRSSNCKHLKIGDIALQCGFEDVSNFNRRFRARFDLTPTQLRERLKG